MSKREKIIVAGMVAAILYGAYSFLFDSGGDRAVKPVGDAGPPMEQFVLGVIGQLKKADISTKDRYLLGQAQGALKRNPFFRASAISGKDATDAGALAPESRQTTVSATRFTYTGYIAMGDNRLAILNGREYAPGDQLTADGVYLKTVTPTAVVLGIQGFSDTVTIDIVETH